MNPDMKVLNMGMRVVLLMFVMSGMGWAQPTGLTGIPPIKGECIGKDLATLVHPEAQKAIIPEKPVIPPLTDNWVLLDSWSDNLVIQPDEYYAVGFDPVNQSLIGAGPEEVLNDVCWQAIDRAPLWLRDALIDQLTNISYIYFRDMMAQVIVDAEDPYVDEIAFSIAHLSRDLVGGGHIMESLLQENAQSIYEADPYLNYVWLIDYGDSNDDDYWTTVRYRIVTDTDDTTTVELDRDMYYWWIVHPRLSDEIPRYIDPSTGQYQPPPVGVFWRDYLFNHADEGYPLFREAMEGCEVLGGTLWNNGTPANGAVGRVTQWINDVMEFGSGAERPIQPVRIYTLHLGRCGEHSDITAAAGRICLIPTLCTMAFCNDHTWNEYWLPTVNGGIWRSWEPVNNMTGDSLAYEGWGHEFPAVFEWRGDGFVETVTERYTSGSSDLNITITDAWGTPVDGVNVELASNYQYGGLYHCTSVFTDCNGQASVKIGENRNIFLRLDSPIGSYPNNPGQYVLILENTIGDTTYEWTHQLSIVETLEITTAPDPPNPTENYLMEVSFEIPAEIVRERIWSNSQFSWVPGSGITDFAMLDADNFTEFQAGEACYGLEVGQYLGSGHVSFALPTDDAWYAVISNTDRVTNAQCVNVSVNLYVDSELAADPGLTIKPTVFRLDQNYPNPFNPSTMISFNLPQSSPVRLVVYNLLGQEVAVLMDEYRTVGMHRVQVDGSGFASGTYFYRIDAGNFQAVRKMEIVK